MKKLKQPDQVRMLWIDHYWDGPLQGVALYRGKLCYFHSQDVMKDKRKAYIYPLKPKESEQVLSDQQEYTDHHGFYWHCLWVNGKRYHVENPEADYKEGPYDACFDYSKVLERKPLGYIRV